MNINTKLKHTAISLVIALILAVSAAPVLPAYAAVGTSVNEEVVNQARSVASIIQTRIQLYWSDWVDKQIPYTQDPLANPAPTWATDAEIAGLVGGATPDGMTFTVEDMPVARDGSFYLVTTVDSSMGGAAAASYVRNFLPMAVASGSTVTVPVLRPSFALGLSDIANNPNKVNRDGTTDDGEPTFTDGANITFGKNGSITFDPVTGGNINNVNWGGFMNYFFVFQNKSFKEENSGGYLWAPKSKGGRKVSHWSLMKEVKKKCLHILNISYHTKLNRERNLNMLWSFLIHFICFISKS